MVTVATPAWWTSGKEVNNNIKQTADKKSVNNTHVSIMHLQMKGDDDKTSAKRTH